MLLRSRFLPTLETIEATTHKSAATLIGLKSEEILTLQLQYGKKESASITSILV